MPKTGGYFGGPIYDKNGVEIAGGGGVTDHGSLDGLGDDDHSQYHTDGRAATWLAANHETTYDHTQLHAAATVADTDTVDLTLTGQQISAAARLQLSLTSDASGIKLSGDSATPGNSKYYGTDGSGTKGFHALPSGSGATWLEVQVFS